MIKVTNFTLDTGEADLICACCKQAIINELTEISTAAGYYHQACGTLIEHKNQSVLDDLQDFKSINEEYAEAKGQ